MLQWRVSDLEKELSKMSVYSPGFLTLSSPCMVSLWELQRVSGIKTYREQRMERNGMIAIRKSISEYIRCRLKQWGCFSSLLHTVAILEYKSWHTLFLLCWVWKGRRTKKTLLFRKYQLNKSACMLHFTLSKRATEHNTGSMLKKSARPSHDMMNSRYIFK